MATASTKEKRLDQSEEEPSASLPVGHPQAGYVSPDLSFHDSTGILPDEEKEWHETRNKAREESVEAVEEGETKAAEELAEATEEANKQAQAARDAQIKKQVDAGLIAAPTPTPGQIVAEKQEKGSKSSS